MSLRRLSLALATALIAGSAGAQEINGRWNASVDTDFGPFAIVFEFLVNAAGELTGSMSADMIGQIPIIEGMVDGDSLAFKLMIDAGPQGAMTINYKGTVEGDELELTSTMDDAPPGTPAEQTITAKRAED